MDSSKFEEIYEETIQQIRDFERIHEEFKATLSKVDGSKITYETTINEFNVKFESNFFQDLTIKIFFEFAPNLEYPRLKNLINPLYSSFNFDGLELTHNKSLLIELFVEVSSSCQQILIKDMFKQEETIAKLRELYPVQTIRVDI